MSQCDIYGRMATAGVTEILQNGRYASQEKAEKYIPDDIVKKLKINITGPLSADTLFLPKNQKKFDVVVGMYHDQVLTPIKTIMGLKAINITLGLPFIRVSPDHGVAADIVGKKIADPSSLIESIKFFNNIINDGYWSNSYIMIGIFLELFATSFTWKLLGLETIGSDRFQVLIFNLIFKISLLFLSYQITKKFVLEENKKILSFLLLSFVMLSLSNFNIWETHLLLYRDLPLVLFLIFSFVDTYVASLATVKA